MALEQGPVPGFPLTVDECERLYQTLLTRRENFPEEDPHDSFMVVLLNAGDPYTPVICIGGEWEGLKGDLTVEFPDIPLCPNGHPLTEGFGIALGWANDASTLTMGQAHISDEVEDPMQPLPPPAPIEEDPNEV